MDTKPKSTKRKAPLPPPTAYLDLSEVAQRWRRAPITTERLLKKFGVPTYRLTARSHLYALADIERIEEEAKTRPPLPVRSTWRKSASKEVA